MRSEDLSAENLTPSPSHRTTPESRSSISTDGRNGHPGRRHSAVFTTAAHCTAKGCGWARYWSTRNPNPRLGADDALARVEAELAAHVSAEHPAPKPRPIAMQPRPEPLGITWRGRHRSVAAWARIVGVHENTLRARLRNGWTLDRALTTPSQQAVPSELKVPW